MMAEITRLPLAMIEIMEASPPAPYEENLRRNPTPAINESVRRNIKFLDRSVLLIFDVAFGFIIMVKIPGSK